MSQAIRDVFEYCPRCGCKATRTGVNPFNCQDCDFTFFFSPTVAVAGVVEDEQGQVLFLRRQKDPGKGKLGLPGGFVDAGETAESAVRREALEEMNLEVLAIDFIASFPNSYHYKGLAIPVADLFFHCEVASFDELQAEASEVAGYHFCHPDESTLNEMAFASNRKAVEVFLEQRASN